MKRKRVLSAILAALAVGGISYATFSTHKPSSALTLANLEALSYTEGQFQCAGLCKYRSGYVCEIHYTSSGYVIYCDNMVAFTYYP